MKCNKLFVFLISCFAIVLLAAGVNFINLNFTSLSATQAVEEEIKPDIILSDESDFDIIKGVEYNNGLLKGLSESGQQKIADKNTFGVIIPASVTKLVEKVVPVHTPFEKWKDKLLTVDFAKDTTITEIGMSSFQKYTKLKSVKIPDSVTELGLSCFNGCSSLTEVIFGEHSKLNEIGVSAFEECSSLESITIPDSVTQIDMIAIGSCPLLKEVKISENSQLQSLGGVAFNNCPSLTSLYIPAKVNKIGADATELTPYAMCNNLTTITVDERNEKYTDCDSNVIVEKETHTLICAAVGAVIPDSVTTLGYASLVYYPGESIYLPEGLIKIKKMAFGMNTELISINIPDTVTTIEYTEDGNTFTECKKLEVIVAGNKERAQLLKTDDNTFHLAEYAEIISYKVDLQFDKDNQITTQPKIYKKGVEWCLTKTGWLKDEEFQLPNLDQGKWFDSEGQEITKESLNTKLTNGEIEEAYKLKFKYDLNLIKSDIKVDEKMEFSGSPVDPIIKFGQKTLIKDQDYTLEISNNTNIGSVSFTITGKNDYFGNYAGEFEITRKDISSNLSVTLTQNNFVYSGSQICPELSQLMIDGLILTENDYDVDYGQNVNAGEGTITITGKGNFEGQFTHTFQISKAQLSQLLLKTDVTYDGTEHKDIILKVLDTYENVLNSTENYQATFTHSNGIDNDFTSAGTITVKVEGKGNYQGTLTKEFHILQANPDVTVSLTRDMFVGDEVSQDDLLFSCSNCQGEFNVQTKELQLGENIVEWSFTPQSSNYQAKNGQITVGACYKVQIIFLNTDNLSEKSNMFEVKVVSVVKDEQTELDSELYEIKYYKGEQLLSSRPTKAGKYKAVVEMKSSDYVLTGPFECEFEIMPTQKDNKVAIIVSSISAFLLLIAIIILIIWLVKRKKKEE